MVAGARRNFSNFSHYLVSLIISWRLNIESCECLLKFCCFLKSLGANVILSGLVFPCIAARHSDHEVECGSELWRSSRSRHNSNFFYDQYGQPLHTSKLQTGEERSSRAKRSSSPVSKAFLQLSVPTKKSRDMISVDEGLSCLASTL